MNEEFHCWKEQRWLKGEIQRDLDLEITKKTGWLYRKGRCKKKLMQLEKGKDFKNTKKVLPAWRSWLHAVTLSGFMMRSRANTGGIAQIKFILRQRIVATGHSSDWIHTACGLINIQKPQSEKHFILKWKIEHSVNVQTGERILKS